MKPLTKLIQTVFELDKAATPGEWSVHFLKPTIDGSTATIGRVYEENGQEAFSDVIDVYDRKVFSTKENFELIAHYRTAAPKLAKICEILWNDLPSDEAKAEVEKILEEK